MDQIGKDLRFVLMRAHGDTLYSPQEDRPQYEDLLLDGFRRVSFIVRPFGGHTVPDPSWFERGLAALDSSDFPIAVNAAGEPLILPNPNAQAQRILATAQLVLERKPANISDKERLETIRSRNTRRAQELLERVLKEYPQTPAATRAREMLASSLRPAGQRK